MYQSKTMSRRTLLRGAGAAVALPLLDAMMPGVARGAAAAASLPKPRMAFLYIPNGVAKGAWEPARVAADGKLLELNEWMKPLAPFAQQMVIPRNVWTPKGNGHGAGTATWLTGGGYDESRVYAGGTSVDQLAAAHTSSETLLPSIEMSTQGEGFFSNSLVRNTLSWSASGMPVPRDVEPRVIFDRMFRAGTDGVANRSVLDQILDDARGLRRSIGPSDAHKVDEYLEAIRSVERRLDFAHQHQQRAQQTGGNQLVRPPAGIPADHGEYIRLMLDMIVLAFWADATRVCSFMLDHGQSNRYFNFIEGVRGTWHALSHWQDASGKTADDDGETFWSSVDEKREMYNLVTRWHHEQVAYFFQRLQTIKESDGNSLLDNSMVLYGSSMSDGHAHSANNLPLLLAGSGGGTIKTGQVIRFDKKAHLSNLQLSMLHRMGVSVEKFGDSTGPMSEIDR